MKKKVLLLGATGRIGRNFVNDYWENGFNKHYEMILGVRDVRKVKDKRFKFRKVNLLDSNSLRRAFKGIDVILNLAANSNQDAEFKDLIGPNIKGSYNVFEEARKAKIKRVVAMSSIHAVKGYPENKVIEEIDAPKPLNIYGATKAFVEALAYVYHKKFGLSCLVIRIGAYVSNDLKQKVCFERKNYDYVISQRDMAQLFDKAIMASGKVKYGILSGISDNKKKRLDLKCTKKLVGYKPKDDAYALCSSIKKHGV
jgi:NAD+ dependent glucose-6-phosphate dehydrogenase